MKRADRSKCRAAPRNTRRRRSTICRTRRFGFPTRHGTAPSIVQHGKGAALACGACHLMSGHGHQESADLAGLSAEYIIRTMADFKSGTRIDPARMNAIAKGMSDEEVRQAAEYFASLKPGRLDQGCRDRDGSQELRERERPAAPAVAGRRHGAAGRSHHRTSAGCGQSHQPRSAFRIRRLCSGGQRREGRGVGEDTAASNKTIACAICHGDSLEGLGDVPRIAGLHPAYVARQLYAFQTGTNHSVSSALMKKVVANLTADDILAISAYAAAQ